MLHIAKNRPGFRCRRALAVGLVLLGLSTAARAADPVDGTDPTDGRAVTGLRIAGEGKAGPAFLYLLCKSGRRNPEIWLSLPVDLGQARDRVELNYSIDGGAERKAWFLIGENARTGAFYILHNRLYEERFGRQPPTIDPATGGTAAAYESWISKVFDGVVSDLTDGNSALFAADGKGGPYRFPIAESGPLLSRIASCRQQHD